MSVASNSIDSVEQLTYLLPSRNFDIFNDSMLGGYPMRDPDLFVALCCFPVYHTILHLLQGAFWIYCNRLLF